MTREDTILIAWIAGSVSLILSGIVAGAITLAITLGNYSCHATAKTMGMNWSYSIWTDCMIEVDGKFIPLSSYKVLKQ